MDYDKERYFISLEFSGENNRDLSKSLYLEAMQGKVKVYDEEFIKLCTI